MGKIRIAIAGIGNCASALIQGIEYYRNRQKDDCIGLMHWDSGGYKPFDIEVVAAFDIDARKVGKDVSEAIFRLPNCTKVFQDSIDTKGVPVLMGQGFRRRCAPHVGLRREADVRLLQLPAARKGRHCQDPAGLRGRDAAELSARRFRAGGPVLRGMRARGEYRA